MHLLHFRSINTTQYTLTWQGCTIIEIDSNQLTTLCLWGAQTPAQVTPQICHTNTHYSWTQTHTSVLTPSQSQQKKPFSFKTFWFQTEYFFVFKCPFKVFTHNCGLKKLHHIRLCWIAMDMFSVLSLVFGQSELSWRQTEAFDVSYNDNTESVNWII